MEDIPAIVSPGSETSSTSSSTRIRRRSLGPGKSPDFEDPYDTRWQEQFDAAPLRPYKTNDEYLYAMREDLADWLNDLYQIDITTENFFEKLETGSLLCQHANNVRRSAIEFKQTQASIEDPVDDVMDTGHAEIRYKPDAVEGTFIARDNISNFIHWCRHCLNIKDVLLFETDDLVLRKNTKSFILCLLEVARRGGRVGMPVPMLVQFEKEIEMELRNSISLSGMITLPSEKSDSLSTGPTSPSSSAATTDIEPESPSSSAELSDSSSFMSSGRLSPDSFPPVKKDSKSKSLPRPTRDSQLPLRRNNSLRRPRQLPCIPTKSGGNGGVKGVDSWLQKRMKNHTSPNRQSLPSALENLGADLEDEEEVYEGPQVQIMLQPEILKSLHERVRELVNRCTCPAQFPMIREAEGKYRIGEAATLIFVRILRNHVMVRVGGGWDTLEHYLDKHDPCRCDVHRKKKPHQRAQSQPGVPLRRSQSPVLQSSQRTRRLSGGGTSLRHSWGNRSWDESVWERPSTPDSPSSTISTMSTKSATTWRRTTDHMDTDAQLRTDLSKTELKVNGEEDEDTDLTSPASDLSAVERLIEEQSAKADKSPTDEEFLSASPLTSPRGSPRSSPVPRAPKRPSRINTKTEQTEPGLQRRRSTESPGKLRPESAASQTKSAPTSPKRNGAMVSTSSVPLERESPMETSDVWRRFAMAGAGMESAFSPVAGRKPRSSVSQQATNRERSESPLTTRTRSLTPTPPKRKSRHDRESKKENVLMIKRDSEGRHRLGSNSSCESNDSQSVESMSSGRRTPERKRTARAERTRPHSTEPMQLKGQRLTVDHHPYGSGNQRRRRTVHNDNPEHTGAISKALNYSATSAVERQRPSSAGPSQSHHEPTRSPRRRRTTVHGEKPEFDSDVSQPEQNNGSRSTRRKLPIPQQKRVTSAIERQRPASAGPMESNGSTSPRRRKTSDQSSHHERVKDLKKSLHSNVISSIERQRPSSAGPVDQSNGKSNSLRRRRTVHGDNPEHVQAIRQSLKSGATSSIERQRPSSAGPAESSHEPSRRHRRHRTVHGDNQEHIDAISRSLKENGGVRRKLPTPPEDFSKRSTNSNVWRRTPDVFDDALRSSLEASLGSGSSDSRSLSGNSSPINRSRPPSRSRLRPVTPVPRHMKVDSHVVTPMRRDEEHKTPSRIPMPVQHKKMLDGTEIHHRRSLPDLMDLPKWLVRRIEQQNLELEYSMDNVFDCSQSHCSSMDSVSPTPSVKAENPNDSGYEDNSATKSSPPSTFEDASPPDAAIELPGEAAAESVSETAMEEDTKLVVDL